MSKKVITVDVREDIKNGREPFSKIMHAVSALKGGEDLLLIAPFEPAPLYGVLAQQGFSHEAKPTDTDDWQVLFTRDSEAASPSKKTAAPPKSPRSSNPAACNGTPVVEVDARGLEPPQPLVKILEALATLPEGARLRTHTDRQPIHLYAQLEERGFAGETTEQKDGSYITNISRR